MKCKSFSQLPNYVKSQYRTARIRRGAFYDDFPVTVVFGSRVYTVYSDIAYID